MVVKGDRHANSIAIRRIPADHRRDPRSLPGRWRWCDRPWLCDAQKASALHTLIRQRHPTPSCGGHAPTAERTMNPARMCLESLDRRPGTREQPGSKAGKAQPRTCLPLHLWKLTYWAVYEIIDVISMRRSIW